MAPILKGIVVIAVEDDAILMIHGTVGIDDDGCHDVSFSPLEFVARPLTATGDGLAAEETAQAELDDWRDNAPERVIGHVLDFVRSCLDRDRPVDAVGVSMFGNVNIQTGIVSYVRNGTCKDWDPNTGIDPIDIPGAIERHFGKDILVCVENDATALALGEAVRDDARKDVFASIWMGKGVNAGVANTFSFGRKIGSWKGKMHPEMGHLFPRIHDDDVEYLRYLREEDRYPKCTVHKDCLIGLVGRRSILDRKKKFEMPDEKIIDIVSYYVAQLCINITLTIVPARITISGYALRTKEAPLSDPEQFVQCVRQHFNRLMNGFPKYSQAQARAVGDFIRLGQQDDVSALLGVKEAIKAKLLGKHRDAAFEAATKNRREAF